MQVILWRHHHRAPCVRVLFIFSFYGFQFYTLQWMWTTFTFKIIFIGWSDKVPKKHKPMSNSCSDEKKKKIFAIIKKTSMPHKSISTLSISATVKRRKKSSNEHANHNFRGTLVAKRAWKLFYFFDTTRQKGKRTQNAFSLWATGYNIKQSF